MVHNCRHGTSALPFLPTKWHASYEGSFLVTFSVVTFSAINIKSTLSFLQMKLKQQLESPRSAQIIT